MAKKHEQVKKTESATEKDTVEEFYNGTNMFSLPNGDTYVGDYCAHVSGMVWREGEGIYYTKDGQYYEGRWKDDKLMEGTDVTITYKDNSIYEGPLLKNQCHGPGTVTFPNGLKFFCNFEENKPIKDVLMADVDGRLWHGVASDENVYLSPENIFYQNIHPLRGLNQLILKQIQPVWSKETHISSEASPSSGLTDRDWEKIIFAKSKKTQSGIDFNDSSWYRDFARYKKTRREVLTKISTHAPLTKQEFAWYCRYVHTKRTKKLGQAMKVLKATDTAVDTALLDAFYSKEFAESSKPYSVIYPTYNWTLQPAESEGRRASEEQTGVDEEDSVEEKVLVEKKISVEEKALVEKTISVEEKALVEKKISVEEEALVEEKNSAEEEPLVEQAALAGKEAVVTVDSLVEEQEVINEMIEVKEDEDFVTVGVGTKSLYSLIDKVLEAKVIRVCNSDLHTTN